MASGVFVFLGYGSQGVRPRPFTCLVVSRSYLGSFSQAGTPLSCTENSIFHGLGLGMFASMGYYSLRVIFPLQKSVLLLSLVCLLC